MSKQKDLKAIAEQITIQNVCPVLANQATQLVPGSGSVNAALMFIGEAPGKKEDILGEPFVGASGRFLNEMLGSIGLSRQQVFVTNIVKYRPPNNRDPTQKEKQDFLPFLMQQIAVIQPRLLITLGKHAMEQFIPNGKISDLHGVPKRVILDKQQQNTATVLPLYHPAAALYNGKLRTVLLEDFSRIPKILKETT